MGETKDNDVYEEELIDYDEEEDKVLDSGAKVNGEAPKKWVLWNFFCLNDWLYDEFDSCLVQFVLVHPEAVDFVEFVIKW